MLRGTWPTHLGARARVIIGKLRDEAAATR
jgi:hypothetical protein